MQVEKNEQLGVLQSNKATNNDNTNSDQNQLNSGNVKGDIKKITKKSG